MCEYGKQWIAAEALYKAPSGDRPGGYLLNDVEEPKNLAQKKSLAMPSGTPILLTPHDHPEWLKSNQAFVATDVTVDELTGDQNLRRFGSIMELMRSLRSHKSTYGTNIRVIDPLPNLAAHSRPHAARPGLAAHRGARQSQRVRGDWRLYHGA